MYSMSRMDQSTDMHQLQAMKCRPQTDPERSDCCDTIEIDITSER